MIFLPRRDRLALALFTVFSSLCVHAQSTDTTPTETPAAPLAPEAALVDKTPKSNAAKPVKRPSMTTAQLFYEVLLGELSTREGDPGDGYTLILDAARRARDPQLFQRAVEIALRARAGDSALAAARAWKSTLPDSSEASRFELQILIALGRISETTELLRTELAATPLPEHPALLSAIASSYARASDKPLAASVVEEALNKEVQNPATAAPAWAAIGRVRLAAGDNAGALDAARKAQEADPQSDAPALLALLLLNADQPQAEPIVTKYLGRTDAQVELRMAYVRTLINARRYDDARTQLTILTTREPKRPEPWLLLGSLQIDARQDAQAEKSILRYIDLQTNVKNTDAKDTKDSDAQRRTRGLTQAYLLLSRIAEHRKDYVGAQNWLTRIDNDEDGIQSTVQVRRATLLARQGQTDRALALVQALPELDDDDKRQKFEAELQVLREARQYQQAYDLLARASADSPEDGDLLYNQAMMAEKLGRPDEMEQLLRRLIELKPDNASAYNALGYSLADRKVRLEEARELIRKAVALAPDDPFIADSLGWVEYRLGNTSEALRILEDAYKRQPDPEIGAHLGEVLWVNGQRSRAMTVWKEAVLADADNETLQETLKRLRVKL